MLENQVWLFNHASFNQALDDYIQDALNAYPQESERILLTKEAMLDFMMHSKQGQSLKIKAG